MQALSNHLTQTIFLLFKLLSTLWNLFATIKRPAKSSLP